MRKATTGISYPGVKPPERFRAVSRRLINADDIEHERDHWVALASDPEVKAIVRAEWDKCLTDFKRGKARYTEAHRTSGADEWERLANSEGKKCVALEDRIAETPAQTPAGAAVQVKLAAFYAGEHLEAGAPYHDLILRALENATQTLG